MVSASTLWDTPLIEYARALHNLEHPAPVNNSTRTKITVEYPAENYIREMVATKIWGDGASYEELRELWAVTGDEDYLERMLEKVDG